ncbi:MAG: hypothetical protein KME16_18160 [Scytolyngbya sp. HA4215-MV1]|jgi:hypothetical protein|nr:hypothetical protein [Scytolyngbya sp. HA4215-MV1]
MMPGFAKVCVSVLTTLVGAVGMITPAQAGEVLEGKLAAIAPQPKRSPEPSQTFTSASHAQVDPSQAENEQVERGLTEPRDVASALPELANRQPDAMSTLPSESGTPVQPSLAQTPTGQSASERPEQNSADRLEFAPAADSRIPADGRSTVPLTGRILNVSGQPIAQDEIVTLTSSAGKFVGADYDADLPGFQVLATQGQFTVNLQSDLEPKKVRVRAAIELGAQRGVKLPDLNAGAPTTPKNSPEASGTTTVPLPPTTPHLEKDLEAYAQVEFMTNLRASLVSGVINLRIGNAGTDYYSSFREFLDPEDFKDGTQVDFTAAVFATGKIGEWLLTGAYNNQHPLNQTCDGTTRLFRDAQLCDQVYPVYGDSSTVDYLTPSIDSVYFRLERTSPIAGAESDYLLWGDYNTQEFSRASQLFTATTRQLHGFKGNYNLGNLQATLMYGNNLDGFQRDTIVPNGTSGFYFLSRRRVLGGSENVFLETEELNRPGTVIERKSLQRSLDYEIDYDRGTLLFRRPLLATEFDPFGKTLVRRIVVTYQFEDGGGTDLYAGRLQYNFSQAFERESWLGASYLREDRGSESTELYGLDFFVPLGSDAKIVGEYARSTGDSLFRGGTSGSAYRLEMNGDLAPGILGRAYFRSADAGFTNNATYSLTPGQTRYGGQIAARLAPTTQLQIQVDREINFGVSPLIRTTFNDLFNPVQEAAPGARVDNSLTTLSAGLLQKIGKVDVSLDFVHRSREDRITPQRLSADTNQIVSRLSMPLAKTVTFRAQNELNLSGKDSLYPDRTVLAIDWAAFPGVTVRLAQQFFGDKGSITSLDTLLDHRLSENTNLTGRYSVLGGANGMTGQGAVGLNHRWQVAPGLRIDLTYEHIFGNDFVYTAAGQQFRQPFAVGQSASSLGLGSGDSFSVGFEYTDNPDFKASARLEHRTASRGNNTVISASALGKISPDLTALFRFDQANASNQLLTGLGDTANLKLGLAYRNLRSDKFNALLRYEYRKNPDTIPDTILFGSGSGSRDHTLAVEAIYAPDLRWEFYGKFALRNSRSYSARDLVGDNTVSLAQFRAAYRLGYNVDLVGELRWIDQTNTGFSELGYVVEAGYYLTPDLRVGVGYAFGNVDDRDFHGRSKGGLYATFTVKLNELFEGFGLQKPVPRQQSESQVTKPAVPTRSSPTGAIAPQPLRGGPSSLPTLASNQVASATLLDENSAGQLNSMLTLLHLIPPQSFLSVGDIP